MTGFNSHPAPGPGEHRQLAHLVEYVVVSIPTRHQGRATLFLPFRIDTIRSSFNSHPAPGPGEPSDRHGSPSWGIRGFNSHPAPGPGEPLFPEGMEGRGIPRFNSHPAPGPGERSKRGADAIGAQNVSIPTRHQGRANVPYDVTSAYLRLAVSIPTRHQGRANFPCRQPTQPETCRFNSHPAPGPGEPLRRR